LGLGLWDRTPRQEDALVEQDVDGLKGEHYDAQVHRLLAARGCVGRRSQPLQQ